MNKSSNINSPIAKKIPHRLEKHDDIRIDNYFWMKDRSHPEVIAYLNEENTFYESKTQHTKAFQDDLFEEMKSRIKEDDSSVPYKYNGYWYITKFEKGKDYPIYTRKKDSLNAPEELLFDCNEMAEDLPYFKLVGISISPDNKKVSFGTDTTGRRQYTLQIKCLETNEIYKDLIENTTGSSAWANDSRTIFYTKKDEVTLRANQVFKHVVGEQNNTLVFEEGDDTFGVTVYKSKSKKYIIIACYSTLTNEYHILNANNPTQNFEVFHPRVRGIEYSISHFENHFYILTNKDKATNFKLMRTGEVNRDMKNWEPVVEHRKDVLIEAIDIFKDYLVISERENGLNQIRIKSWDNSEDYYLPFNSETYTCYTTINVEFRTKLLRYSYNSLTTPPSVIEYNMETRTKKVLKEKEVLGGKFDKSNYISERIWAEARDGEKIPMSVVYRKGMKRDGSNPLLQYAYGSYGSTVDPHFSSIRLSLLDRGFIYVITHVRGGEYLGRSWYDNGKLLNKKNTFTDFIDCSIHLIRERYTSSKHLYAMGGSAGGLLMGAVINEAPELYHGIVAAVPFVDVITTMLDDSIPLTTGEYDEWGNPNDKLYYNYMKSYSPYDNLEAKAYPNMLVTAGLHDSQVQYWEPAKWVAKIREYKTDNNQLFLKTNMDAGHGGASGRFESIREDAGEFAFLLALEDITQ
ncbi:S9 family peptidase [Winogradskyella sp. DF17]|uniref:S9 family peptidase n=1 Tax=Winogradskyella pelagia TaxID=2819984 RepID=A0ABS3T485_9FLAO|nr:S9 family peptidase [Winogradskyella sp. DF17]MBO3117556.1 S9 family peptidase [Winogradskyella sp. DF17]